MSNNRKIIISESEKKQIQKLYGLSTNKDYVFDFVLSENKKYLIIMDQVFVEGKNGKSIGSIWDHTDIFNEILKESLSKVKSLNEEVQNEINDFFSKIEWTKDLISEWVNEKHVILEGFWDTIQSGLSKFGEGAINMVKNVFTQGVIPFLRWVRRGLYTGVGIVIDVVVSILAAKTNAIVWVIVVLLDIGEIITGNYDPQDPERMKMPFFFLLADTIGALITGATALSVKKSAAVIAKEGVEKGAPWMVKILQTLGDKLPSLKNMLTSAAETLTQKMGPSSTGFISTILRGIDTVLGKLTQFITSLLSKKGAGAVATGVGALGISKGLERALPMVDKQNKFGQFAVGTEKYLQNKTGLGQMKFSPEATNAGVNYVNNLIASGEIK